jgi:hypothetical protein
MAMPFVLYFLILHPIAGIHILSRLPVLLQLFEIDSAVKRSSNHEKFKIFQWFRPIQSEHRSEGGKKGIRRSNNAIDIGGQNSL